MGKLLKQIEETPVNTGGIQSSVDLAIQSMQGEDREDILCALRNESISASVLSQVLKENDYKVSRAAIVRWRMREGI
jgi:hypothetical protein